MSSLTLFDRPFNFARSALSLAVLAVGAAALPSSADPREERGVEDQAGLRTAAPATAPDLDSALRGIRSATTTEQALDAYSAGSALDRDNVALQEAYVRQLISLNAPQVAEPVARRLVGISPNNPFAWSVLSVSEAKRGNMVDALTDIALAARKLPEDPFVQRTSGELLAWYDNAPRKPQLSASLQSDLQAARQNMAASGAFTDAYDKASNFYKNPPTRPEDAQRDANAGPANGDPKDQLGSSRPADVQRPADSSAAPPDDYYQPAPPPTYVEEAPYYTTTRSYYYDAPAYGYYRSVDPIWPVVPFSLFIGGDWGYCYGGGWYHHYDHWGHWDRGGYGHGDYGRNYYGDSGRGAYGGANYGHSNYGYHGSTGGFNRSANRQGSYSSARGYSYSNASRGNSSSSANRSGTRSYGYTGSSRSGSGRAYSGAQRSYSGASHSYSRSQGSSHSSSSRGSASHSSGGSSHGGGSHSSGGGHSSGSGHSGGHH